MNEERTREWAVVALSVVLTALLIWPVVEYFPDWFVEQSRGYKWGNAISCIVLLAACFTFRKLGGRGVFIDSRIILQVGAAMLAANLLLNAELWENLPQTGHACLFALGLAFLLMAGSRVLFGVLFGIGLLCSLVDAVCRTKFGIVLDHDIVVQVLGANMTEVKNYLTPGAALLVASAILFVAFWLWLVLRIVRREKRLQFLASGLLFLTLAMVARQFTIPLDCKRPCAEWPLSITRRTIKEVVKADEDNRRMVRMLLALPPAIQLPVDIHTLSGGEGVVCILHVGESARADHMGLYGYERNTTPWLQSRENVIKFNRCISHAPFTIYAFISIMTDACGNVMDAASPHSAPTVRSVADLFVASGFKDFTFCEDEVLDEGRTMFGETAFCQLLKAFTPGGEPIPYHGDPMGQVQQIHEKLQQDPHGNTFILINNIGSHAPFAWYDRVHTAFTPAGPEGRTGNPAGNPEMATLAQNAYDNTIRYTDEYIRRLLTGMEHRPFLYVYVGDHGEYVGDDGGRWERGQVKGEYLHTGGCLVPFLIVASPELEAMHPHFRAALERLRANSGMTVSQDHVFHTVLGIFGISCEFYNAAYDLSSAAAEPYTGEQPSFVLQTAPNSSSSP